MRVVAQMFVRNGEDYLPRCLRHFREHGIEVAILDHGSTDATPDILRAHRVDPVADVVHVPFEGVFDLARMLTLQQETSGSLGADWYILAGVDEILESDVPGEKLCDAIERVDAAGFAVVNFNEFVFVYEDDEVSYVGTDYVQKMLSYYFFAPEPLRLMRAVKAGADSGYVSSAGHRVSVEPARIYPGTFILRHYMTLGREHAVAKYVGRKFAPKNLARGWHFNRVGLQPGQFAAPPAVRLLRLPHPSAQPDASHAVSTHFWQWPREAETNAV
jgi:hypothetical protein